MAQKVALQHNELTGICSNLLAIELIKSVCTKFATNLDKNILPIFSSCYTPVFVNDHSFTIFAQ